MSCKTLFLVLALGLCLAQAAKVTNIGMKHQYLHGQYHSTFSPSLRQKIEASSRQGASTEPNNNAMGGNILPVGIYWMTVEVGTPPQIFSAAVDSGSGDLIIPSQDCVGCHPDQTGEYNPAASSTSMNVTCGTQGISCFSCNQPSNQCTFSNTYQTCNLTAPQQSCTVTGSLFSDAFALGGEWGNSVFGAIEFQTANFQQFFVIDAVVGFIPHLSSFGGQSLFQTLADDKEFENIFAMCMNPDNGGVITLGGTDDRLQSGDFMYTPQTDSPYFEIRLSGFNVDNSISFPVSFGTSKFIVDSGTNVLLVRTSNFLNIKNAILEVLCPGFSAPGVCDNNGDFFDQVCYPYTQEQREAFPSVTLVAVGEQGEDVNLVMNGVDYVVANGTTGEYCYGIKDTGKVGLDIIGDTTMQNYYVSFDVENRRLGWADVDMGYCMKVMGELSNDVRTFGKEVKGKL